MQVNMIEQAWFLGIEGRVTLRKVFRNRLVFKDQGCVELPPPSLGAPECFLTIYSFFLGARLVGAFSPPLVLISAK